MGDQWHKGDIVISGGLGHYQLSPVKLQYALSGQQLQDLDIPAEFLAKEIADPEQPVRGLYYAYQAVLNNIKNNTQFAPDFEKGKQVHKLLDRITQSAAEGNHH
ncbi:hypothetical protein [Mucilaginibacter polytrichastri]|uniref:Gfo/Idh/MocA-like oxidoreductase C-terminal domain-containing protein n=1 Tax=Mucilaginibacter polytrichastri TaxID=1302689 RepID=A0A1Q5ZYB6_9SPHI|nr:hypothetical protein [Mucilaginibacter polytrichastri]OKS86732.1 hypothetical protein RG47T_2189 [Mucilaginibacter polytrichastri]SFS82873.1 hypothetical protein SAMN04487890_104298 [Mucilaginibacter polytrichastri]